MFWFLSYQQYIQKKIINRVSNGTKIRENRVNALKKRRYYYAKLYILNLNERI